MEVNGTDFPPAREPKNPEKNRWKPRKTKKKRHPEVPPMM